MTVPNKKRKIFDGRYEILGIVGRGSKSVVYHARLVNIPSEEVAIKVLINTADVRATRLRLRNEALSMVTGQHPYVLRLNDFHSVDELSYLSLEYAALGDLRKYLGQQKTPCSPAQADRYFRQLAEALYYIHSVGIIHRDIKPDNILVVNNDEIRLGDFGTAIIRGEGTPEDDLKKAVGTLNYLAPEVLKGEAYDHRADIYSLGLTFYEALLGKHPFESAPMAQQLDIRLSQLPPLSSLVPELPQKFSNIIARCLNPVLSERYSSAREILQDLKEETSRRAAITPIDDVAATVQLTNLGPNSERYPLHAKEIANEISEGEDKDYLREDDEEQLVNAAPRGKVIGAQQQEVREYHDDLEDSEPLDEEIEEEVREETPADEDVTSSRELISTGDHDVESNPILQRFSKLNLSSRRVKLAIGVAAIAFLFVTATNFLGSSKRKNPNKYASIESELATQPKSQLTLTHLASGVPFSFPDLAEGVYLGSLSGIFEKQETPLTIVSLPDSQMAVFLGIEGWTPQIATIDKGDLRVASNGYVLRFTGEANSDTVFGTVTHVSTGRTASWSVSPVRE